MRQNIQVIILLIMFGLFGCKKTVSDYVFDEFKAQIEKQGMKIDSVDETGLIYISQGELTLKISLDNVRRNYERDKDKTHISDLVQTLASYSIGIPATWGEAKPDIYISLFPNDNDFKAFFASKNYCGLWKSLYSRWTRQINLDNKGGPDKMEHNRRRIGPPGKFER